MQTFIILTALGAGVFLIFTSKKSYKIPNITQQYNSVNLQPKEYYTIKKNHLYFNTLGVNSLKVHSYELPNFNYFSDVCNPNFMSSNYAELIDRLEGRINYK